MTTKATKHRPVSASGKDLVPDLETNRGLVTLRQWYWVGAMPGCPRESLAIGGIDFPKMSEDVRKDRRAKGGTRRTQKVGQLVSLTETQLRLIAGQLPYRVIRFDKTSADDARDRAREYDRIQNDEARQAYAPMEGAGSGLEALDVVRRKGRPIRIPTSQQKADAKKHNRRITAYTQDSRDEPAARYLFAELCDNQTRPRRGDFYPEPLEVTGLEWPTEQD